MILFGTPGPTEMMIILAIILVIFGGSKLPGLAKGLGQGIKEFKKALGGGEDEEDEKKKEIPDSESDKK
jgi:sec-independent protein translocase protein TatA